MEWVNQFLAALNANKELGIALTTLIGLVVSYWRTQVEQERIQNDAVKQIQASEARYRTKQEEQSERNQRRIDALTQLNTDLQERVMAISEQRLTELREYEAKRQESEERARKRLETVEREFLQKVKRADEAIGQYSRELEDSKRDIRLLKRQREKDQTVIEQHQETIQQQGGEIRLLNEQRNADMNTIAALKEEIKSYQQQIARLEAQIQQLTENQNQMATRNDDLQSALESARHDRDHYMQEAQSYKDERDSLLKRVTELEEHVAKLETKIEQLQQDKAA